MKSSREAGTTLVEVLITTAILAVVLLFFLSVMGSANALSANSKELAIASYELQAAVEDTYALTFDTFKATYPNNHVFPAAVYNKLAGETLTLTWLNQDPGGNWVEYQIQIRFTNFKGKAQTDAFVTRRSR